MRDYTADEEGRIAKVNFEHIRELPKTEDDKYLLLYNKMIAAIFRYKCSFPRT